MNCPVDYTLTVDEMQMCIEFSRNCAPTQQDYEFGETTTAVRNVNEISRDNLIGKIAEVAFKRLIETNYPAVEEIPLDFEIYERGTYDNQDTIINGYTIDVKGTRQGGNWFLIEWNKLRFRYNENNLPNYFAAFTVGWNRNTDLPTGVATLQGFVPINWLSFNHVQQEERIKILRRNALIPNTNTRLQADNYGILFRHLIHSENGVNNCINRMISGEENRTIQNFILPPQER